MASNFETISNEVTTKVAKETKDITSRLQAVGNNRKGKLEYLQISELDSLLKVQNDALINAFTNETIILRNELNDLRKENEELKTDVHELKKDLEITKRELIETKIDMDKNNQYGRREMIRLHNVTEPVLSANTYERVEDTVVNVLKDAGYEIDASMIASAQRLPAKKVEGGPTYAKPITFKLTSRFNRNSILREQKLKMRENVRFQGKHKKVFMTEDLAQSGNIYLLN